ncbi:PAP/fibrillin family [Synechococcus sp. PCC 7335]|uniref:PAP/fibrillin family protein n=1 Tax=Synechococcus sp. (strain ATCC 29403 / PCC 7335) TaxID=91464 RepID=UPI00017ECED4|nr:PAP/fibrillin family protein [Synechococcus sp. PCC 7335]EDX87071.1 PAP/fibrillin family [Synechococcus sp. PCC 7335]
MLNKTDLRNAIANTNRGISTTANDRQAIASIIARVEDLNPTPNPLSAPELLAGDWRLLYTTSQELLGIDRIPFAALGNIYQCVRPSTSQIYNIAEVNSLPFCEGIISVVADFMPAPADESAYSQASATTTVETLSQRRVNVRFNRAVFGLQRSLGYQSPTQYIEQLQSTEKFNFLKGIDLAINSDRQQGWLEITYLDKDMRIGRGNQGSLFVLTKDT